VADTAPTAAGSGAEPVATCYRHPLRPTGVRCSRCERPICPDCMRPAAIGYQCPDDAGRAARQTRGPVAAGAPRTGGRPYVTWALIAVNVGLYVLTAVKAPNGINAPGGSGLFEHLQMQPSDVAHDRYWRLLTAAFLHWNLLHLGLNMLALAVAGPYLEPVLGRWRYLAVYAFSAVGGSVAVYLFGSAYDPVAGASGAIFGLFAAALLLVREIGIDPQWLVGTLVLNFVLTFTIPDISWLDHVGGLVAGGLTTALFAGIPTAQGRRPAARLAPHLEVGALVVFAAVLAGLVAARTATL
jgi:membrane associated rhomboid family serine protease